jgi:uncharacterized membrane protein YkvA (DUF1232 family)
MVVVSGTRPGPIMRFGNGFGTVRITSTLRRYRPWEVIGFALRLPAYLGLFWRLLGDRRVHLLVKALLLGGIIYALSPLDFIPDFVPFLGQLDDLAIIVLAGRFFLQLCPPEVVAEHAARIDPRRGWVVASR